MPRALPALLLLIAIPALTQPRALTTADYARAESFLASKTNPLVLHAGVRPVWLNDTEFWYRNVTETGLEFVLVHAPDGVRTTSFDRTRLAAPAAVNRNEIPSPDGK